MFKRYTEKFLRILKKNLTRRYKIRTNVVLLWSDDFNGYSCNPKYLAEYIIEKHKQDFEVVWVLRKGKKIEVSEGIKSVELFSYEYFKYLNIAKFIITNHRINEYYMFKKKKGQVYIQLWHSSIRLKHIERDAIKDLSKEYIESAKIDSQACDLIVSGSEFSTNIYKNSFWYEGDILEVGTPRIDYLLKNNKSKKSKKKIFGIYNLKEDRKLILYAPTFRKDFRTDIYNLDVDKLVEKIESITGEKYYIGIRLHPNIPHKEINLGRNSVNLSNYTDMQELLLASEILITDYSSCMFDYIFMNKLCFLYVPDKEKYLSTERGSYFNIENLPFLVFDNNQFIDCLTRRDLEVSNEKYNKFLLEVGALEVGQACEKIIAEMNKYMKRDLV